MRSGEENAPPKASLICICQLSFSLWLKASVEFPPAGTRTVFFCKGIRYGKAGDKPPPLWGKRQMKGGKRRMFCYLKVQNRRNWSRKLWSCSPGDIDKDSESVFPRFLNLNLLLYTRLKGKCYSETHLIDTTIPSLRWLTKTAANYLSQWRTIQKSIFINKEKGNDHYHFLHQM